MSSNSVKLGICTTVYVTRLYTSNSISKGLQRNPKFVHYVLYKDSRIITVVYKSFGEALLLSKVEFPHFVVVMLDTSECAFSYTFALTKTH